MAAIGHDMCDKKYMDENEGIEKYKNYLSEYMSDSDLDIMGQIIGTMSYSKVKVNGFPELGEYQTAYHIVREADLMAAYDIDRCIIYTMYRDNCSYTDALKIAVELFDIYTGKGVEDGMKSVAVNVVLRSEKDTLHEKEVNTKVFISKIRGGTLIKGLLPIFLYKVCFKGCYFVIK